MHQADHMLTITYYSNSPSSKLLNFQWLPKHNQLDTIHVLGAASVFTSGRAVSTFSAVSVFSASSSTKKWENSSDFKKRGKCINNRHEGNVDFVETRICIRVLCRCSKWYVCFVRGLPERQELQSVLRDSRHHACETQGRLSTILVWSGP